MISKVFIYVNAEVPTAYVRTPKRPQLAYFFIPTYGFQRVFRAKPF